MRKIALATTAILLAACIGSLIYLDSYFNVAAAQTLYWGSTGAEVRKLQQTLKNWDYYKGPVDGEFGAGTFEAVKSFQRKNGLTADGVVGAATRKALGFPVQAKAAPKDYQASSKVISRDQETTLIARAITGEARGEEYIGQVAIGAVILNRSRHPSFPNTIAGVIYQPLAFTAVADGQINMEPTETSFKAARDALNGWDPTGGCLYYWNPATATSKWIWSRTVEKKIGKHWFGN